MSIHDDYKYFVRSNFNPSDSEDLLKLTFYKVLFDHENATDSGAPGYTDSLVAKLVVAHKALQKLKEEL